MNRYLLASAGIAMLLASGARAQELVTNGGFETGDMTGWTLGDDKSAYVVGSPVHSGIDSCKMTPGSSTNMISQSLATTAGQTYNISIWIDHLSGDAVSNSLALDWNGSIIPGSPTFLQPNTGWVDYTYQLQATSASTVLAITAHDPSGNIFVDDVSVQAAPAPEPATMAALGLGVFGLVRRVRRRQ